MLPLASGNIGGMPRSQKATDAIVKALRTYGLGYPGAHTKSPWPGHLDVAVKDKTFGYLSIEGEPLRCSFKLPSASAMALMLPFATPTEYGLGKSGWVSATFGPNDEVPVELLKTWMDESYRAQAPKKLVAMIGVAQADAKKTPTKKKSPAPKKRK